MCAFINATERRPALERDKMNSSNDKPVVISPVGSPVSLTDMLEDACVTIGKVSYESTTDNDFLTLEEMQVFLI